MKRKIALSVIIGLFSAATLSFAGSHEHVTTPEDIQAQQDIIGRNDFNRAVSQLKSAKRQVADWEKSIANNKYPNETENLSKSLHEANLRLEKCQNDFDAICKKYPNLAKTYAKAEVERLTKELADAQELLQKVGG